MGRTAEVKAADEWRRYGMVPVAGAMGYSAIGLQSYGFGPFVSHIENSFGWSRTELMAGLTLSATSAFLFSMAIGLVIDRIGPRRVGLIGLILKCCGFALLATATGSMTNWLILWAIMSLGVITSQANVWTSAVASRFDRGRGFAMATALAGTSITAAIAPILATFLMADHSWRFSMAALGLIWLAVTLPIVLIAFRGAQDSNRGRTASKLASVSCKDLPGLTVKEGIRLPIFWILAGANFSYVAYTQFLGPNLVPLLSDKGARLDVAAALAGLIGIFSLVARLSTGFLLDKYPPKVVAVIIFLLPVGGCGLMLMDSPSYLIMAIAVITFGATVGAEHDVIFYLTSRHMGLKSFAALIGAMMTISAVAGIVAPILGGYIYDRTGSYDIYLLLIMALMGAAAVSMAMAGKPKQEWDAIRREGSIDDSA